MRLLSRLLQLIFRIRNRQLSFGKNVRLEPALLARGGVITIGDNTCIRLGTVIMPAGGSISIGANTTINHYCVFHGGNDLRIGEGCLIAPRVSIFAANHEFRDRNVPIRAQGMTSKDGVEISDDVWIGTGAIILDGVRIGAGAVIGAGSVVTKDIDPYSVNVGNPARKVCYR